LFSGESYTHYKDVTNNKKAKKSKSDRHSENESDVEVKSYEEILREKVLRNMLEKREKERFENDFEVLLEADKQKRSSKNKKYGSDGDETVDTKSHKSRKESIDLETVVFDKEDAVELEVDEDEFDIELEHHQKSKSRHKKSKERKRKPNHPKVDKIGEIDKEISEENNQEEEEGELGEPSTHEEGVLMIPDETTDLTFSVDATDDLALELNQEPETKQNRKHKPIVVSKKHPENKTDKRHSKSNRPTSNRSRQRERRKRNIMVVDSDSLEKENDKSQEVYKSETQNKVVSLVTVKRNDQPKNENNKSSESPPQSTVPPKSSVKVKTFEEIMEEKRKRKLQLSEIVVVSDNDLDSPGKNAKSKELSIKERSEKFKSTVLDIKDDKAVVPPPQQQQQQAPKKTLSQLRKEKLELAKQEYEKRRKTQQLYQVKSAQSM